MIECREKVAASQSVLFDITQDYAIRMKWDPFPELYRFLNGDVVDVGLQLEVNAKNGYSMIVEYVSFNRPNVAAVKMIKGPWFINSFAGSWSFKKITENESMVIFKYRIIAAPKWANVFVSPIMSFIFRRTAERRLLALKKYVEIEYK